MAKNFDCHFAIKCKQREIKEWLHPKYKIRSLIRSKMLINR
mgnify:CR=1 FL=1